MKILVCLKPILDPATMRVNRRAGKVIVNREDYVINPTDRRALEAALRIKDSAAAQVIAAAAGPERTADALREARAVGADQSILLRLPENDDASLEKIYAALFHALGDVDLVMLGDSALDTGSAAGPYVAEMLALPYLGGAVACAADGKAVRITRAQGKEYFDFEAHTPAVISFGREAPPLRYPHGGAVIEAYRDPNTVEAWSAADLNLNESDLRPLAAKRGQSFPAEREFGKRITVEQIALRLK